MRSNLLFALILPVAFSGQDVTTATGSKDYPNTYSSGFVLEEDQHYVEMERNSTEILYAM